MNETCKWYICCPIKKFVQEGKLEPKWINDYCLIGNKKCIRYQMEEKGTPHPNNMLPNGEIREDLK
ncbi:MAG: uracil-DNA glycosylase [Candidatus Lokiarchaeota archaeon]|nr:uracil-DNA glycosylase [Candidatus Lokiarchaeota archaeon]MBD3200849.1 uracil-DNA glycosylase [Candidatus Lokiarchaeota archaeon]